MGRELFRFDRRPFNGVEVRIPSWLTRQLEYLIVDGRDAVAVDPGKLTDFNRLAAIRTLPAIPCGST